MMEVVILCLLLANYQQVVHTYVPLSPHSITWYWSKDSVALLYET